MSPIDRSFVRQGMLVTPLHLQTEEKLREILHVRNDARIRKWMNNHEPIVEENHIRFCRNLEHRNDAVYLSVEWENSLLGVIYLTDIDLKGQNAELGLYRNPDSTIGSVGLLLMTILEATAQDIGVRTLRLRVRPDNDRAIKLYQRLGYSLTNESDEYLHMQKDLTN